MARKPGFYAKDNWYVTSVGGKQHHKLCRVAEGKKNAEYLLAKLLVKQEEEPKPLKKGAVPTVAETHDDFLDAKSVESAAGTYEFYKINLKGFYEEYGARELKSLSYQDGIEYKKSLMDAKYGNNTINARLQAVKAMLTWASAPSRQQKYLLMSNPFSELKRMLQGSRERVITEGEFTAVMAMMFKRGDSRVDGGKQNATEVFTLMKLTTMRPQELRCLRWEYIRWNEHKVVYPAQVIKTRRRREITLIDDAKNLLLARRERLKAAGNDVSDGFVFFEPSAQPQKSKRGHNRLSYNVYSGKPVSASALSSKWRRAIKLAAKAGTIVESTDVGTLVPYSFRHTRITELVLENHPFPVVMAEAGHASPKTTIRYVHLATNQVIDSIRAADDKKKAKPPTSGASGASTPE